MSDLIPKPIQTINEMNESMSNSPNRERISGGYNTYDNILKLVQIYELEINIPEITPDEIPEVGYTAFYSTDGAYFHGLDRTPFVEAEWRDISIVGSGGAYSERYNLSIDYNNRQIRYIFTFDFTDTTGSGGFLVPFDPKTLKIRVYIYNLNNKRRLDTYVK